MSEIGSVSHLVPDDLIKFEPCKNFIVLRIIQDSQQRKLAKLGLVPQTEFTMHSGLGVIIKMGPGVRESILQKAGPGDVVCFARVVQTLMTKDQIPEMEQDDEYLLIQDDGIVGLHTKYHTEQEIVEFITLPLPAENMKT